ncbi:CD8A protein, partial [Pedionomus torquatus]|nr:CD8A protein [Pedionomus torquatus]
MARSPALLLLALGFCEYGHRGQRYDIRAKFRDKITTHPKVRQPLELECLTSKEDSGAFWIRQDKGGSLYFIVFISSLSRTTFNGNEKTSKRFEARKDGRFYRLVVKSFTPQDEGTYFCLMNINQVLYFSPGQPAFFPVTTTAAPTTTAPTIQRGITEKDPCPRTLDTETSKGKEINFFCDIFIWVPLSGACLLLLLALAVTITVCQQTRRRRCRCKR